MAVLTHCTSAAKQCLPGPFTVMPPVWSEFLNGLSGRTEIPRRYERDSCIRRHSSITKDTDAAIHTVAPLTAYVYRQAIFSLGYCFAKRQTERTSYNRSTHQQPPPASPFRPTSHLDALSLTPSFSPSYVPSHIYEPTPSLRICSSWDLQPKLCMYTSYRPSTPTGEPIRVDRSSSVLLFTLRHFNEMQHFPNAVHAFFYLKTRVVDCSRECYWVYRTCISKLESTETSFSGRKFFGGLQQNYSLIV